jgi:putative ABC transport system substrate-binding protein
VFSQAKLEHVQTGRARIFMIRRREFITFLGGAVAWPLAARAQPAERMRRIGVLMSTPENDLELQARYAAFRQGLEGLGWMDGRNLRIDIRWGAGDAERARALAADLLRLTRDLIVVGNTIPLEAVLLQSRSVPVLFVSMADPVETGFVESFARPGGNITGFTNFEVQTAGKWLELLKEMAAGTTRAIVIMQAENRALRAHLRVIEGVAPSLGMRIIPGEVRSPAEIERAIDLFAREPNGGLIVLPGAVLVHRALVIAQAARHRLPAIYPYRFYAEGGGLASYGVDGVDIYRRGAAYADRILRGEKPGDLPIQTPTKYELVINLKTAKALGLTIPLSLLGRADEVIE